MPPVHSHIAFGETQAELRFSNLLGPSLGLSRVVPVAPQDITFIALLNGSRSSGGLQRLSVWQAAQHGAWRAEVIDALPACLANRTALGINWDDEAWVPGFQFDRHGSILQPTAAVFLELTSSHDHWELATWFVTPSTWLRNLRPIDLLELAPTRVLAAARADRYVANGR